MMAAPPLGFPPFLTPLPPGWTEHQAPGGQAYYYHAASGQSTYVRPLAAVIPGAAPKQKKERPRTKTPVPGTDWLRVTTTEGNVFWTHKERKESLWEVPDEIKEQVATMEREEREKEERERAEKEERELAPRESAEEKRAREEKEEVQRVTEEVKDAVKRKAEEPVEDDARSDRKRSRVEDAEDEDEQEQALQREMAEEMAAESADAAPSPQEEPPAETGPEATSSSAQGFKVPNRVDLSLDEAKALFKTLLQEKEINPLHPWDTSLPQFIKDPRYVLLPSVAARREAFDEYCRDTIRAQRLARAAAQKAEASDTADPDPDRAAYSRLLREEVTSTRTTWQEFRRHWKKDRRFFGWAGDRERERAFRDWVRGLGEMKRKAAEKAEREFFQLLREHKEITPNSVWKEAKRKIDPKDPRYDAVGSSSLREELFGTYIKTFGGMKSEVAPADNGHTNADDTDKADSAEDAATRRRQRAERDRAETVRRERQGLERELGRTRGAVGREEGERAFMTLLTDAVRDPQANWDTTAPQLAHDPRFILSALPNTAQRALFSAHVARLQMRPRAALHTLFAAHTPGLATTWNTLTDDARAALVGSAAAKRLGLGEDESAELEREFVRWQRTRGTEAREAFDKMLGENAFLEFWGRMGKAGGKELDALDDADEEEEGEGGGGRADLKKLAKSVDVEEVAKVLRNDARWTAFDHIPDQREQWLKDHMEHLAAPKLSVHVPDTTS